MCFKSLGPTVLLLALLLAMAASNAPVVHAATTIMVTTIDDESDAGTCPNINSNPGPDGVWSLREAICATNNIIGADTINITATGVITLSSLLDPLKDSVTINGPGASNLTISGAHTRQVFHVSMGGKTFSFQDLTIADGSAASGGGIEINGALAVTVNDVVFSGNSATSGYGGAIYNWSGYPLTVTNSTFTDNSGRGGAIAVDGSSTLVVANSTFSGNAAGASGGGTIEQIASGGWTSLTNVTVSSNDVGAALYVGQGVLSIRNSIVVNNPADSCLVDAAGTLTDGGNNIDSGTSCNFSALGSMSSTDPKLGSLANNGGPTQTMALLNGSPAINAGNATICAAAVGPSTYGAGDKDQRGLSRRDGFCDIGAFEAQPASLTVASGSSPQTAHVNAAFALPLKANVKDANSNTLGGVVVTFAAPSTGPSAVLGTTSATSNTSGNAGVSATANNLAGSYGVTASATGVTPITFNLTNMLWSTTTTITSDMPDPSHPGQAVTVVYTVTSPYGTPTGSVTVSAGTTNCTGTVAAGSCTLTFTTPGDKTLTASYAGDGNFAASTSISHAHTVSNWGILLPLMIRP